ncbi:MAG TPA: hypothetical protein VKU92_01275 [Acidimicrobiales bacterium]|nr:hypothetical protein [Acidimicrobiales bacterium]
MRLTDIVEGIAEDLRRAGAVGGEETSRVAELLVASIEPSLRLHLLDALHEAARELAESAPGVQVDVRMEGREPVLSLVVPEVAEPSAEQLAGRLAGYVDDELARLTLRLPEGLKGQVETIAAQAGASINSWIVSALARALAEQRAGSASPPGRRPGRRMTGYVRG